MRRVASADDIPKALLDKSKYAVPSFSRDLPETKRLDLLVQHLYFLRKEARDILHGLIKATVKKFAKPNSEFYNDPRLLEIFLIQAEMDHRPNLMMCKLYKREQFRHTAEFYVIWAMIHARKGDGVHVMQVYNAGCFNHPEPFDMFIDGIWKIAKKMFGAEQAITYGFLSGSPIPNYIIEEIKQKERSTDTMVQKRPVITITPPTPDLSDPEFFQAFERTYNYTRMIKYVKEIVPLPDEEWKTYRELCD